MIDFVGHKLRVLAEAERRISAGQQERAPATHDYTLQGWGHSMNLTTKLAPGGEKWSGCGWGFGVNAGDYCLLAAGARTTRYRFTKVKYFANPPDMFSFEIEFAAREATT